MALKIARRESEKKGGRGSAHARASERAGKENEEKEKDVKLTFCRETHFLRVVAPLTFSRR